MIFPLIMGKQLIKYVKTKDLNIAIKWDCLVHDLKDDSKYKILFNFYLYLRKILYSLTLVHLHGMVLTQLIVITLLNLSLVLFMVIAKPFKSLSHLIVNLITEILLMVIQMVLFYAEIYHLENWIKEGWIIVICASIIVLVHTLDLLVSILILFKNFIMK